MGDGTLSDAEVVAFLRRPLPPESVGFKMLKNPQARGQGFSKGQAAGFHDARSVVERLNAAVPGEWADEYKLPPIGKGLMCGLTIRGVTRWDVGFAANTETDMGVKALYSDAFKRAGVKWGIGAFLYAMPRMYVEVSQLKQYGQPPKWFMPDATVTALRTQYGRWLASEGIKHFGDPTMQGDSANPQGDTESAEDIAVPDEPDRADEEASRQTDESQMRPRGLLEHTRTAVRAKDSRALPDKEWKPLLAAAKTKDEKQQLLTHLNELYEGLGGDAVALRQAFDRSQA